MASIESARLSHLPHKRQIASIAFLKKIFSLNCAGPMDLMDFITTFVGKEAIGSSHLGYPFLPFIHYPHAGFPAVTCSTCSVFIGEASEIGSQQPGVNNPDWWVSRAGSSSPFCRWALPSCTLTENGKVELGNRYVHAFWAPNYVFF